MVARAIALGLVPEEKYFRESAAGMEDSLADAILFGIRRGVATDVDARDGLFVAAKGGVLFLDEAHAFTHRIQNKLLRVLQAREIIISGDNRPTPIDVRILFATNEDLEKLVRDEEFTAALLNRMEHNGTVIRVPSLNERREDIPTLAQHFLNQAESDEGMQKIFRHELSHGAIEFLIGYDWSGGNCRALRGFVLKAVKDRRSRNITADHFRAIAGGSVSSSAESVLPIEMSLNFRRSRLAIPLIFTKRWSRSGGVPGNMVLTGGKKRCSYVTAMQRKPVIC